DLNAISTLSNPGSANSGANSLRVTQNGCVDKKCGWLLFELTLADFASHFLQHREVERKSDCGAYVPGIIRGDRRTKLAVCQLDWLIIDLDRGEDILAVIAAVRAKGLYALVHSTFSHMSSETDIVLDDYRKFTGEKTVNATGLRRYL